MLSKNINNSTWKDSQKRETLIKLTYDALHLIKIIVTHTPLENTEAGAFTNFTDQFNKNVVSHLTLAFPDGKGKVC